MPANSSLTAPELVSLNLGYHVAPSRLSYVPDTVIGTATVATTPSTSPITQLSVTSPSANWDQGRVGQTVKITSSDGLTLRGYFCTTFVAPTDTTLYILPITNADSGLLNIGVRTSGIIAGDICTLIERYDLWSVAPRWDATGAAYQFYNRAVSNSNNTPEPIVNMTINGRAGDYCTEVANGASKAVTATVAVSRNIGALSYSWDVPSGWTSVSGTNTATVTGNAPVGAYWLYCTVTDAGGYAFEAARFVRIHSPADPPIECNVTRDTRDRSWRSMTVRLPQGRVSAIPAKARCVVWGDMTWGGSDVASANRSFTGYLMSKPFMHSPVYYETNIEIVGTCGVLDALKGYPAEFKTAATSTTWEELPASYSTLQFLEWWICRWRVENLVQTFNFTPHTTSTTTAKIKTYSVDPGSIYGQMKQIAESYECNVGSRSDGEVIYARHPSMMQDRTGVVTRGTMANSIYKVVDVQWEQHPRCGFARLEGAYSDLTARVRVAGEAPGKNAYGQGQGQRVLQNRVFESQADANQRVGRLYAMENNEYPRLTLDIPTNWDVFEPPDMQRVPVTVPSDKSPTGIAFEVNTIPLSVNKTWTLGRLASIQLTTEAETNGVPGETGEVSSEGGSLYPYGDYETPVIESPGWGEESDINPIGSNGSGLLFTSDGRVAKYDGDDFTDISPSSDQRDAIGTGIKMIANPWSYEGLILYGSQGGLRISDHNSEVVLSQPVSLSAATGQSSSTTNALVDSMIDGNGNNTGVFVGVGDTISINTTGTWQWTANPVDTTNADGTAGQPAAQAVAVNPAVNFMAMLYRIGTSGSWGLAGSSITFTATTSGVLYLIANDDNQGGHFANNVGSLSSAITKTTASSSTASANETYITDIQGSINHEGYFGWLSKRTVSAVDYVYYNYTSDSFATRKSVQLARYAAGMGYSVQLGSYGAPGALVVLASAGDPGTTDTGIYRSVSSGVSFAKITGTDLLSGGGAIVIPYQVGGVANATTTPDYYGYVRGHSGGSAQFRAYSGATVTIAAGSVPINGYVINSHTLDGDVLAIPFTNQIVHRSLDGGDTWGIAGTVPGSGLLGMTGWPTNPDFAWAYGSDCLASTDDGGANWIDQRSDWDTFIAGEYGGGGSVIVSAFGDLHAFYSQEVTQ